jgi:two-component system chemotaxis response regulator CheY
MRFLVIDDSLPMRRIITNVLARLGHTDVVAVSNGREALKRIETETIDVVITDWYMPEVSGIEFLRTIRSNAATKDLPIIIVSANGSKDDVAQAIQLRVSGYVLKPFTAETLRERIAAICNALPPRVAAAPGPVEPAPPRAEAEAAAPTADAEAEDADAVPVDAESAVGVETGAISAEPEPALAGAH